MSNKKHILKTVNTDAFLDIPETAQLLYFHLAIRADNKGFIPAPMAILRSVKCKEEDWDLLISMGYISGGCLDYGVFVITEKNRPIASTREF